jgi:hypothetical protein
MQRRKWALDCPEDIYAVELERVVETFYSNEWSKSSKEGNYYIKYIPLDPSKPEHVMMPQIPDYVYGTGEKQYRCHIVDIADDDTIEFHPITSCLRAMTSTAAMTVSTPSQREQQPEKARVQH